MSRCPLQRDRTLLNAASNTMNSVAPSPRASRSRRSRAHSSKHAPPAPGTNYKLKLSVQTESSGNKAYEATVWGEGAARWRGAACAWAGCARAARR